MLSLILRRAAGCVLVAFGLFALVTPLTPGAWLGLLGLELLGLSRLMPERVRTPWNAYKKRLWEKFRKWKQ